MVCSNLVVKLQYLFILEERSSKIINNFLIKIVLDIMKCVINDRLIVMNVSLKLMLTSIK